MLGVLNSLFSWPVDLVCFLCLLHCYIACCDDVKTLLGVLATLTVGVLRLVMHGVVELALQLAC